MKSWSPDFEDQLLLARNYREFLHLFFTKKRSWDRPLALTFQGFANRSGFASKSFLKDVIAGRKRLTRNSFEATVLGLGLSKTWANYLEALIGREESSFQNHLLTQNYFEEQLRLIKNRIKKKKTATTFHPKSPVVQIFLEPYFPEVYASLGTVKSGAELKKILKRTALSTEQVINILNKMIEAGLVIKKEDKYIPLAEALDVKEMKSSQVFQKDYFRSLDKAKMRFQKQVDSKQSLFLTQTFSVSSLQLSLLKNDLANLINDFASEAEDADGDTIAELNLSFTNTLN